GVHGIEHDALESRQLQHHVELFATDGGTSDSLIAIEEPDFGRRPHGEPEAAAREIHHLGDVRAYARSLPGDRHADDVGAKTRHLLGHQRTGLAAAAEIGDRDRVELGRAVTHLLRDLLAARQVTERADHGGAALGDDIRHPALGAGASRELLHSLVDLVPIAVGAVLDLAAEQPTETQIAIDLSAPPT